METEKKKDLMETYVSMMQMSIDAEGIRTPQLVMEGADEKLTLAAMLGLSPDQIYTNVVTLLYKEKPTRIIFGLDRFNKKDQGVDMKYNSVFTIVYFDGTEWKVGAMPYSSPEDVGEIQWDNKFWTKTVRSELKLFGLIDPDENDEPIGEAYKDKLVITHYRESRELGLKFYEGLINEENLDDKTKKLLKDNSLNINKRDEVMAFLRKNGHTFDIDVESGLWNLHADKAILPARTSRTKVYLEGVESIANQ